MSLMAQVDQARSTLQEANNALSGARGVFPPLRPPQSLVEISPELHSEVLTGAGEALWEMGSDLWDTVTNPIGSVVDALEGVQELIDDPIGTAQEVWEDFTEPYVEDWENGREGEAIGRGLVELGANFIPGYNVLRWLDRFDDANSDDGPEAPEAPPSEFGSSDGGEPSQDDTPSGDGDDRPNEDSDASEAPNDPDGSDGGEPPQDDTPSGDGDDRPNEKWDGEHGPVEERAHRAADYADANGGEAQPGYVGDRPYNNDGRGPEDMILPEWDANGNPITYREYDVNLYQQGVNRGPERIVIGTEADGSKSYYYTSDHYGNFVKFR